MVETKKERRKDMDSKEILKKYAKPSSAVGIIGAVLLAIAAVLLVAGIFAAGNAKNNMAEPVLFDSVESKSGSYVYLDVVGISNWLYDYDGAVYYSAEDAQGYLYTVRVSDADYKKMTAQQEYFVREDENAPQPAPYRLVGLSMTATKVVKDSLASSWEISTAEYEKHFGTMYLNATTDPVSEAGTGFFVFAFLCFLFGVLLAISGIVESVKFKKTIQALEQENLLDRAAAELNDPNNLIVGKDRARLSEHFLFGKGSNAMVPYSDIQWVYHVNQKRYFVTVNCSLFICTLQRNYVISYGKADKNNEMGRAVDLMSQRNPNILLGLSSANRRAYNERKKAAKTR
jgi:hypothetical protein